MQIHYTRIYVHKDPKHALYTILLVTFGWGCNTEHMFCSIKQAERLERVCPFVSKLRGVKLLIALT